MPQYIRARPPTLFVDFSIAISSSLHFRLRKFELRFVTQQSQNFVVYIQASAPLIRRLFHLSVRSREAVSSNSTFPLRKSRLTFVRQQSHIVQVYKGLSAHPIRRCDFPPLLSIFDLSHPPAGTRSQRRIEQCSIPFPEVRIEVRDTTKSDFVVFHGFSW